LSFRVVRSAEASWQGAVPDGGGRIGLGSGAFDGPYSLRARVEEDVERATNPEELLGAAEAGCFTMSLANVLTEAGHPARDLRTTARVTLEQQGSAFNITRIELRTVGDVPGIDDQRFAELAREAKDCTVSRVLTGTEISLDARLAGS
jgi:lipoyl-dependent peroxiredoxin